MIELLKDVVNIIQLPTEINDVVVISYLDQTTTPIVNQTSSSNPFSSSLGASYQNMGSVFNKSCNINFNEKKDVIIDKVVESMENLAKFDIINTFNYSEFSEEKERELFFMIMCSTNKIMEKSRMGSATGVIFPNRFIYEFLYSTQQKEQSIYKIDIDRDLFKKGVFQYYGSNKIENIIVFKTCDDRNPGLKLLCGDSDCDENLYNYHIAETGLHPENNFVAIKTNNRKGKIARLLSFFNRE